MVEGIIVNTDFEHLKEGIIKYYEDSCSDVNKIGIEIEFFCVESETGYPISFIGERSISTIFDLLVRKFGYVFCSEEKYELKRNDEYISLEPGGQIEYSGPACYSEFVCFKKVKRFFNEIYKVIDEIGGLKLIHQGFLSNNSSKGKILIQKERYSILADYLVKKEKLALQMMNSTASLHINSDYFSEPHAMKAFAVTQSASTIVASLFPNSINNCNNKYEMYRKHIWNNTDSERCGLLYDLMVPDRKFIDYIEKIIKIPLIYIYKDNRWLKVSEGITFEEYMKYGFKEYKANLSDYLTHLNSIYHEVRIKKYIEIRSIDAQPPERLHEPIIFWRKVLSTNDIMDEILEVLSYASASDFKLLHESIALLGVNAKLGSKKVSEILNEIIRIVN
jgi:glutamate--cysteine ligase